MEMPTNWTVRHSAGTGQHGLAPSGFSPAALVAVAALLVVVFLLVSYYQVLSSCWATSQQQQGQGSLVATRGTTLSQPLAVLPLSVIEMIPVFKYAEVWIKSTESKEQAARTKTHQSEVAPPPSSSSSSSSSTECVVCLTEFEPDDDVKVLPCCDHWFHVPCIDTWLSKHSARCPLCRSKVELKKVPRVGSKVSLDFLIKQQSLRYHWSLCSSSPAATTVILPDQDASWQASSSSSSSSSASNIPRRTLSSSLLHLPLWSKPVDPGAPRTTKVDGLRLMEQV